MRSYPRRQIEISVQSGNLDRIHAQSPLPFSFFEDAEYFLVIRDLLTVQHSTRCMINYSKTEVVVVFNLFRQVSQ